MTARLANAVSSAAARPACRRHFEPDQCKKVPACHKGRRSTTAAATAQLANVSPCCHHKGADARHQASCKSKASNSGKAKAMRKHAGAANG